MEAGFKTQNFAIPLAWLVRRVSQCSHHDYNGHGDAFEYSIWRFPEIGVPPNHGFSIINHPAIGDSPFMETPIFIVPEPIINQQGSIAASASRCFCCAIFGSSDLLMDLSQRLKRKKEP